jgi:hypothetical protein
MNIVTPVILVVIVASVDLNWDSRQHASRCYPGRVSPRTLEVGSTPPLNRIDIDRSDNDLSDEMSGRPVVISHPLSCVSSSTGKAVIEQ